jgi:capsular polysaccharide export protein
MVVTQGSKRSFLFLQGLATPFFVRLARAVAARGHEVHRINICGGDGLFWPRLGAVAFRGRFADWRGFLGGYLRQTEITDIVLFGDCRPYHRVAVDLARARGIAVHVFEEGYFRPDWITLERDGTNAFSSLPRDAAALLAEAGRETGEELKPAHVGGGFSRRVLWEMANQLSTLLLSPLYPHYRRHRSHHPLAECGGWIRRLAKRPAERLYTRRVSDYLQAAGRPYYLLPLQLETDYQIRRHSGFRSMTDVLRTVLDSFAREAPAEALLVIKLHPLDNGLVNFRKRARRLASRLGIGERVLVIDGGHLPTLLAGSRGVVVVNSTTGLSAINHGRPLKVLGRAVFDMPGLTFQDNLDRFWREGGAPDAELFRAFRRVVLKRAQVNGSFFTRAGTELAVRNVLDRLGIQPLPQAQPQVVLPARPSLDSATLAAESAALLSNQQSFRA